MLPVMVTWMNEIQPVIDANSRLGANKELKDYSDLGFNIQMYKP